MRAFLNCKPLSRRDQREMQTLDAEGRRMMKSDAAFFKRFPHRSHRIRLASRAELREFEILLGDGATKLPEHQRAYVVMKQILPGFRSRLPIFGPADADIDSASEDYCRARYELVADESTFAIEQALLAVKDELQ